METDERLNGGISGLIHKHSLCLNLLNHLYLSCRKHRLQRAIILNPAHCRFANDSDRFGSVPYNYSVEIDDGVSG
jgi:hypothetical protein